MIQTQFNLPAARAARSEEDEMTINRMYRNTDPVTSRLAAEHMVVSGKLSNQHIETLKLVRANPGMTSEELAMRGILDRYQLARRLPELERDGLVRKGPVRKSAHGRMAHTWEVAV